MSKYKARISSDIDKIETMVKKQRERSKLYYKSYVRKKYPTCDS